MPSQSFHKNERLRSRKLIDALIKKGKSRKLDQIQLRWVEINETSNPPAKMLVTVPKKIFKRAVDRNLVKRRIREAYRKNKNELIQKLEADNKSLNLMFIYYADTIYSYSEIENKIVVLLKGLFPPDEIHF